MQKYVKNLIENHPLRDLGVTHKVHLWLDRKRTVDFLLVIIELFLLALTVEALLSEICQNRCFLKGWVTLSAQILGTGVDGDVASNRFRDRKIEE